MLQGNSVKHRNELIATDLGNFRIEKKRIVVENFLPACNGGNDKKRCQFDETSNMSFLNEFFCLVNIYRTFFNF